MTTSIQPTHLPIAPRSSPFRKSTTNSNFPITHLPTDILLALFRVIPSPQTLSALSLCSRQFHHYITPYLYSHFLHLGDTCTSLPHFLHTILHNPHYALYTKTFTCNALLGYRTDISISNFSPSDLTLLKSRLQSIYTLENGSRSPFFGSYITSQWYNFILQGNWDAIVALILCLLPNLQSLNIINHASGCPYGYPYLETVLNRAAKLQNQRLRDPNGIDQPQLYSLPHLRSLHLAKHDTVHYPRMGFEILRALPFLAIPSIREVDTHMLSDYHFPFTALSSSLQSPSSTQPAQTPSPITPFTLSTFYSAPLPHFTFHITHLHLSHTVLRRESLVPFFSYFKSLKSLQWEWEYNPQIAEKEGLEFSFDMNHFLHSIEHLRDILEVLRLRVSESSSSPSSSAEIHDRSEGEEEEGRGGDKGSTYYQQRNHTENNESDKYNSIIAQLSPFTKLEIISLSANLLPAPEYKTQTPTPGSSSSSSSSSNSESESDQSETKNKTKPKPKHHQLSLPPSKSKNVLHLRPNIPANVNPSQEPRDAHNAHEEESKYHTPRFHQPRPQSFEKDSSSSCEQCAQHIFRAQKFNSRTPKIDDTM
ncbi:hypothetical protein BOTCAL_0515g00070 [Botryotinia calthae]|uniref:F-box domain-containing protein n=1 Tax=Botryotinia calthae TaxID=38488 RepID=A0A4Y8CN89_9HELO|nr:hypothetical protein BOTCAL_0515g00070 [Botryotinia calthae]